MIIISLPLILKICFCIYALLFYKSLSFSPCVQPNTEWISEDGTIQLYVKEDENVFGFIEHGGEKIPIIFSQGHQTDIYIYYNNLDNKHYMKDDWDKWVARFWSPDYFTITVIKSKFFEEGTKIKFHKIM